MGLSRRQFTKEFKLAAVRRLEQGVSIAEATRALEVSANVLHRWRREFRQGTGNAFPGNGKQRWSEGRIADLERKIGQQALEVFRRFPFAGNGRGRLVTETPVALHIDATILERQHVRRR